jgi:hypothetical protein
MLSRSKGEEGQGVSLVWCRENGGCVGGGYFHGFVNKEEGGVGGSLGWC